MARASASKFPMIWRALFDLWVPTNGNLSPAQTAVTVSGSSAPVLAIGKLAGNQFQISWPTSANLELQTRNQFSVAYSKPLPRAGPARAELAIRLRPCPARRPARHNMFSGSSTCTKSKSSIAMKSFTPVFSSINHFGISLLIGVFLASGTGRVCASGPGALSFAQSSFSAAENSGAASIVVIRQGGSAGTVSVNYATTGGSAKAGANYTPVSGTLTFAPGQTAASFMVPLLDDGVLFAEFDGESGVEQRGRRFPGRADECHADD